MEIDISRLRDDLENYFGTAMCSGLPMAAVELAQAQSGTPQQLVELARRAGLELSDYAD